MRFSGGLVVWWLGRRVSGLKCRVQDVSLHKADLAREWECNLTMAYAVQMLKCDQIRINWSIPHSLLLSSEGPALLHNSA